MKSENIQFVHPYYEKEKSFEAFPLGDFLRKIFVAEGKNTTAWSVQFEALDGYKSVVKWEKHEGKIPFRQQETAARMQVIRGMTKTEAWTELE